MLPVAKEKQPMHLALCAGSFAEEIQHNKVSLEEVIHLASKLGFAAVEIRDDLTQSGILIGEIKSWAEKIKLKLIYAYRLWPLHHDPISMHKNELVFRRALQEAHQLGVNVLKIGFGTVETIDQWSLEHSSIIRGWLENAEQLGVTVCLENGKQTADLIHKIVQAIDHDYLKTTLDSGNYVQAGTPAIQAARILASQTGYVHLKDVTEAGLTTWLGNGMIPFEQIIEILQRQRYQGYWCFEFPMSVLHSNEIKESLEYLSKL